MYYVYNIYIIFTIGSLIISSKKSYIECVVLVFFLNPAVQAHFDSYRYAFRQYISLYEYYT